MLFRSLLDQHPISALIVIIGRIADQYRYPWPSGQTQPPRRLPLGILDGGDYLGGHFSIGGASVRFEGLCEVGVLMGSGEGWLILGLTRVGRVIEGSVRFGLGRLFDPVDVFLTCNALGNQGGDMADERMWKAYSPVAIGATREAIRR
jgi:hypothetical protein